MTERSFIEDAAHLLGKAEDGDVAVAALARPGKFMMVHVAGRDPDCLVAAARSLLEQASDRLEEDLEDEPRDLRLVWLRDAIREALEALPDPDDDAEEH